MRTASCALVALMAWGGGAIAQTADEATDDAATAAEEGGDAASEEEGEDGTILLRPGAEGEEASEESGPVETDADVDGEAMQTDGTVPIDESPEPGDTGDAFETEGGEAAGAAAAPDAEISTDATASGESMEMDGTVPVDESPEPEDDAADSD